MAEKITSADDLEIYNDDKNIRIFAGPGAGKTHLLIENIKNIIKNSKRLKENNGRKILCITYTNAAVEEINKRLGAYSKYVVVSTIHAFINEYIISPYQKQLKLAIKEKFNINIPQNVKIVSRQEGFSVLSGHSKEDIYDFIKKERPDLPESDYNTLSRSKMCDIKLDISEMNKYPFNSEADVYISHKNISDELANTLKAYIWGIAGKIDFDEILYFGLVLIETYPIILYMLRAEFPYILMDEYQDTNPIQNRILDLISEKEVSVVVVGDIAQSIFSFQGATYQEFKNFQLKSKKPIITKDIEGNRRSTQNIIKLTNFIRQKVDSEFKQECIKNIENNAKVTFLIQKNKSCFTKPLKEIILPETRIICRKWSEVFNYIDDVTDEQKKLINNIYNAYTYAAHRDLTQEIDAKREDWIASTLDIAELEESFKTKNISKSLKIFEKYLDIKDIFKDFERNKLKKVQSLIKNLERFFAQNLNDKKIKDIIENANQNLLHLDGVNIVEQFKYPNINDENYFEAVYKHIDELTYICAKKIVIELFSENSKYMTVHKSKGKEFNSVLVNLEPFSNRSSVEKEFKPEEIFTSQKPIIENNTIYEEYLRIAYVACSRAINKLYIHIHGDESIAQKIEKTLDAYYGINSDIYKFYEFVYC